MQTVSPVHNGSGNIGDGGSGGQHPLLTLTPYHRLHMCYTAFGHPPMHWRYMDHIESNLFFFERKQPALADTGTHPGVLLHVYPQKGVVYRFESKKQEGAPTPYQQNEQINPDDMVLTVVQYYVNPPQPPEKRVQDENASPIWHMKSFAQSGGVLPLGLIPTMNAQQLVGLLGAPERETDYHGRKVLSYDLLGLQAEFSEDGHQLVFVSYRKPSLPYEELWARYAGKINWNAPFAAAI
ncbi:hypothetical protein GQ42DRAFT_161803 [Ramicandelaber brevisporus]|nr:hypothetical protein GQ42DRAFT_161803 [Ramicandelaber brevisporus]